MGLPNINIEFKTTAGSAVTRQARGVVGLIVKDAATDAQGEHVLTDELGIPSTLGADNKAYISRAFLGYVNRPSKVIVYVLETDAANLNDALAYFATQQIDYMAGPPDCTAEEATAIASWVAARREEDMVPKAVLPNKAADSEAIINFTTAGILADGKEYTAAQYCSRIAGLLAGTPLTIASTYAPLSEVTDITRLTKEEMDTAIDAGQFILYHDGTKVKVGRGVNSLVTTNQDKGEAFKKIKIVEAVDTMRRDIMVTAQDNYIGKYANSYDNKCLLISAIQGYFTELENQGVLQQGSSTVGIDLEQQRIYLSSRGIDVSKMTDQQIKEADTGDQVYLAATVKILDAIEDIHLIVKI